MNSGQMLAHYEIIHPLGKGGMGEVYLADDTKLQRQVALKFLPESVRNDPDRLARFKREALAAASLKHNNIATIYALEDIDNVTFIVMEYVAGDTLADIIPDGGMDVGGPGNADSNGNRTGAINRAPSFFDIFIPLADALSHAHQQGRVHRDLKPANIMVTPEGIPKILDFGLARIEQEESGSPEIDSDAPTQTMKAAEIDAPPSLTQGRSFMGTPAYMSPEQIEGKKVDARSDLFSFGVVMYEALTGQRPFKGDTVESIIGRILESEPEPLTALKPVTPYTLWEIVRKCIRKDREERTQTARLLHADLRDVQHETQAGTVLVDASTIPGPQLEDVAPVAPDPIPLWRQSAAIAFAVLTLVIGLTAAWFLKPSPESVLRKYHLTEGNWPHISPDGTMVAYVSDSRLWVRDLDQLEPREIPNTEGARVLFWSPRSDEIGYVAGVGDIRKVSAQGGPSTALWTAPVRIFRGLAWRPDGMIVFRLGSSLYEMSAQGGDPAAILQPDSTMGEQAFLHHPHVLPDGKTLVFAVRNLDTSEDIVVQDGETRRVLVQGNPGEDLDLPVYASSGHLLYRRGDNQGDNIWAIPFDLSSLTRTGKPILVAENATDQSVSTDGTLVYRSDDATTQFRELVWVDRTGQIGETIGQPHDLINGPALSPDGKWVVVDRTDQGNRDIWVYDIERGSKMRLTYDPAIDRMPRWSPDGTRVLFNSQRSGSDDIYTRAANGSGAVDTLLIGPLPQFGSSWSGDDRFLLYYEIAPETNRDLWALPLTGDRTPVPILQGPFDEWDPNLSPDGRYVAYVSEESGLPEIFVIPFPSPEGRKWQVSVRGGLFPRWNGDGTELFYMEDTTMMAVAVDTRSGFSRETPIPLFSVSQSDLITSLGLVERTSEQPRPISHYDVTGDGQRFVMLRAVGQGASPTITVVQNWYKAFKDRQ